MKIITMGIDSIDKSKFRTDGEIFLNKPRFGLWGSSRKQIGYNKKWSGWLDFVAGENFYSDKYHKGIMYNLHKNAKVYEIYNYEDYINMLDNYGYIDYSSIYPEMYIDWNKFAKDYDAFHITEDAFYELRFLYCHVVDDNGNEIRIKDFYSYDCETWIIFNLDCINQGSIVNISVHLEDYWKA